MRGQSRYLSVLFLFLAYYSSPLPNDLPSTDPSPDDPSPDDPSPNDSSPNDPSPNDPSPNDPLPNDPSPNDPLPNDSQPNDLSPDDPYFIKAIAEGGGYLKPAVVIMHGPPGAGKTSVKRLFLGKKPLHTTKQNSTG